MARIREYQTQVGGPTELPLSQVQRQAFASDFGGGAEGLQVAGRGVQQAADDAGAAYRMIQDQKARAEVTDAAIELNRFNASATLELKNAINSGEVDNDDYPEVFQARINANMDQVRAKYSTTAGQQAFDRGAAELQGTFLVASGEARSRAAGIKAVQNAKEFVETSRNTVMNDPFQFERIETNAAAVINDPKGVFAAMPAELRAQFARETKEAIAQSAVQGVIKLDPQLALDNLDRGHWDIYLNANAKHALRTEARVGIAGQEAERRRQEAEAERKRKLEIKETQNSFVAKLDAHTLTSRDILDSNLDPVGDGSKEHFLNVLIARAKDSHEVPIKKDPKMFLGILQGIRSGDVTSEATIEGLYAASVQNKSGITWEDVKQLRTELDEGRTVEGERLNEKRASFFEHFRGQIDKSNPFLGKEDQTGKQQLYDFEAYVNSKIREYKKEKKDPHALFDSKNPDFVGAPDIIAQYQKTIQQSIRTMSENTRRKSTTTLPQGMTAAGTIDLAKRVPVENPDGTFSTVVSKSFEIDGREVLLPTLDPTGSKMTDKETIDRYKATGEHLGIFTSPDAATKYAKHLSKEMDQIAPRSRISQMIRGSSVDLAENLKRLEKAVASMPGEAPKSLRGPRLHGETTADYLRRTDKNK